MVQVLRSCPNTECRHRLLTGGAAEYGDGRAVCADCGAALVDAATVAAAAEVADREEVARAGSLAAPPRRSLGFATLLTLASVVLAYVPLPRARALVERMAVPMWPSVGWLALGLTPLLAAYQLVELVALSVPRWRELRLGDARARWPLARAAYALGFVLAGLQAWSVAVWLETYGNMHGDIAYGWGARLLDMGALLAGLALLVGLARLISRFGLGNGYSWLLLGAVTPGLAVALLEHRHAVGGGLRSPIAALAALLLPVVLFVASRRYLRASAARSDAEPERPREPTSGVLPAVWAAQILLLPVSLAAFVRIDLSWLTAHLVPGGALYTTGACAITVALAYALTRAFYKPRNVARGFRDVGVSLKLERFLSLRGSAALRSTLVVGALPLGDYALSRVAPTSLSLVVVVMVAAIVEDIADEWRGRRVLGPDAVPLCELSRLYQLAPARARLSAAGVASFVRAAHHRTLLSFFGPFIPTTIFVAAADRARAEALVDVGSGPRKVDLVVTTERVAR